MAKVKGSFNFLDIEKSLITEFNQFTKEMLKNREIALDEASDYLLKNLQNNTPEDTGDTKKHWIRSTKYKGVRYINNTEESGKGKNPRIPVVNVLEFSKNGKPFVRKTFDASIPEMENIIKKNLNKGD